MAKTGQFKPSLQLPQSHSSKMANITLVVYLVVFIVVQNLVGIDSVVLKICKFQC